MANPTLLDMPIARDGNKNTIPATDNGTTGLLSQQYGWQLINAIPPQQGGKAVKREDFNGALYLLSNLLFYLQKGWQFEWNSSQAYYAGCIVKDTSDGKMYQCLNDTTNTVAPHSDTTNWKLWDLSAYLPLAGGEMVVGAKISQETDASYIKINAGRASSDDETGITINGKSRSFDGGHIRISSIDNSDLACEITSTSTGLEWLKYTSYSNNQFTRMDLGGSAIVAKSFGTYGGYIKRASGEIIQWGRIPSGTDTEVTFPISFTSPSAVSVVAMAGSANTNCYTYLVTSSKFHLCCGESSTAMWIARGF